MKELSFVEVIKVEDGLFVNSKPHIERIFRTTTHFFSEPLIVELSDYMIPIDLRKGVVKCRIVYINHVVSIEFQPYKMRSIGSLAIVEGSAIDYSHKYFNVVFKDLDGNLYTPTSTLLAGTKRQSLLEKGAIHEKEIHMNDIHSYVGVYLINAMIDIEDNIFVGVDSILQM